MATSPALGAREVPASSDGLPDIPRELIVAGATGHLVVLVGAGASFNSGLPLWGQLIDQLFQRALEDVSLSADQRRAFTEVRAASGDLLVKASFLRNEMGAGWVGATVASVLRASPSGPTETHRALAEIPDAVFATTNYDALLEAALADREGRPPKVVLPSDLEGIRDLAPGQVLKLHGDLDHPETIVLSIKDYIRVGHSIRPAWKERLKAWLQPPSQILLVGYSFSDVDLQEVLSQLQGAYEGTLPGPFWLERRGHLEGAKAKDYDLRPIWLSEYPHAAPWLRKLARAIDEEKARRRSPAPAVAKVVAYAEYVNDKLKARTAEAAKLFNEQRYEDARAIYEEVLHDAEALAAKAPEEGALRRIIAGSRLNVGCCLLCQQRSETALDVLRRVADHDVEHLSPEGRASLASGLAQRGDIARARAVLPGGDAGLSGKARDSVLEARQLIDVLEGREPQGERVTSHILDLYIARLRLKQGRLDAAREEAIRSADAAPEDSIIAFSSLSVLEEALRRSVLEDTSAREWVPREAWPAIVERLEEGIAKLESAPGVATEIRKDTYVLKFVFYQEMEDPERTEQALDALGSSPGDLLRSPFLKMREDSQAVFQAEELAREDKLDEALATLPRREHPWAGALARIQLTMLAAHRAPALHARALDEALALVEAWPGRALIEYLAADLLLGAARYEEALEHAQRAWDALPGRGFRLLLGQCLLGVGRPKDAWDTLAPLEGSRNPQLLRARAIAAERAFPQKAPDLWEDYLRERPDNDLIRLRVAYQRFQLGDVDGAADAAWDLFEKAHTRLDVQSLYACAEVQRLGGRFSEGAREEAQGRVRKIVMVLEERFPGDPEAEHFRLMLLALLGFPTDARPIDFEAQLHAGHLRAVSLDEFVESVTEERAFRKEVHSLYRSGRLPFESLCELLGDAAAGWVTHFDRMASERGVPALSAPIEIGDNRPFPGLDGARILTGELELLVLQRLGILNKLGDALRGRGKLLLFEDVWQRITEAPVRLERTAQRVALAQQERLLERLKSSPKAELVEEPQRPTDLAWAAAQKLPIAVSEPAQDGAPVISPRALVLYLKANASIAGDQAERLLRYLPAEPEPVPTLSELPARLAIGYTPLYHFAYHEALDGLLAAVSDKLLVGPETVRILRERRDELREAIEAADLAAAVQRAVGAGVADGWIQADLPRPTIANLPDVRPGGDPVQRRALFREPLASALAYRQALLDDPDRWLLTADFFVASAPSHELALGLAWASLEQFQSLVSRIRPTSRREIHLPALVRRVLSGPEAKRALYRLTMLGVTDALQSDDLLDLYRRYGGLDKGEPKRTLDRLEWTVWQEEPEHAGANLATLRVAAVYGGVIADAFIRDEWRGKDADRNAVAAALLGRAEAIDDARAGALLDLTLQFTAGRLADRPKYTFERVAGDEKTAAPSIESPAGRLWGSLLTWAGPEGRRRAAIGRAIRSLWLMMDDATFPKGPDMVRAAPLLIATSVGPNSFMFPEVEAPAILSATWAEKPLSFLEGKGRASSLEEVLKRGAEVATHAVESIKALNEEGLEYTFSEGGATDEDVVPPAAVLLRMSGEPFKDLAIALAHRQGPHDGRAYDALEKLIANPGEPVLRRAYARMAVLAPFRLVREDPRILSTWARHRRFGVHAFPVNLDDLRQMLSEPTRALSSDVSLFDMLRARMQDGGAWADRSDAIALCEQACQVPGLLPSFLLRQRLAKEDKDQYVHEVTEALRRLEGPEQHSAARLAGDIFFLRLAAARKPYVLLTTGEIDLRERLPERLVAVLRSATKPTPADTLAHAEAGLLRLCSQVVEGLASPAALPLKDGLWLTYRLFQWLCAQLEALPPAAFFAGLRALEKVAPPPSDPLPVSPPELLHPSWFDGARFNHRLAAVLYAFAFMEDLRLQIPSVPGEIQEPLRPVTSTPLEDLLAEIAARPLTPEERAIRARENAPSLLDWHGPGAIPDLALYALLRLNGEAFFRMAPEHRMRWLEDLPRTPEDKERVTWSLASVIVLVATVHAQRLSPGEKVAFREYLRSVDVPDEGPSVSKWRWLGFTQLFGAGMTDLEDEVRALFLEEENLKSRAAPEALASYLTALSFVAPERLVPEAERLFAAIEAVGDGVDPVEFAPALGRVIVTGNPDSIPAARKALSALAARAPYKEHERIRRLLGTLGMR